MTLEDLLRQHKSVILEKWINALVDSYPADTSRFIKAQKDPFANPVGNTISNGLDSVFDDLIHSKKTSGMTSFLNSILKIRAVQNFSPSQAVAFVFSLKNVIKDVSRKENIDNRLSKELFEFDSRIDQLGLIAFDIYEECREKLYEIKANEERNRTFSAFERAGLIREVD